MRRYRFKHLVEYGALRAAGWTASRLPYRGALLLAWLLAWPAYHVFRFRARAMRTRLREVFGERYTPRELNRIAWHSVRNLFFTAVDIMRLPATKAETLKGMGIFQPLLDELRKLGAQGKGVVVATLHMGAWELGAAVCWVHGLPVFSIAGRQRNPLFDAYLNRTRSAAGYEILTRGDGLLRSVLRRLREGKCLAVLSDVRMPTPGLPIRFLGKTANIGPGTAQFARLAGVPILPAITTRHGWGTHEFRLYPLIWPDMQADRDEDCQRMTQAVFDIFDAAIRADPGQWFWFNRRWILEPLAAESRKG